MTMKPKIKIYQCLFDTHPKPPLKVSGPFYQFSYYDINYAAEHRAKGCDEKTDH